MFHYGLTTFLKMMFTAGIDIGSDTAVIARTSLKNLETELVRNDLSKQETPVIISFAHKARCYGEEALQLSISNQASCIDSLLYFLQVSHESKISDKNNSTYPSMFGKFERQENGRMLFSVIIDEKKVTFSSEQILAMMLSKLESFTRIENSEEEKSTSIPIAFVIPDFFSDICKQAIQDAFKIAKLDLRRLITRSEASAMEYGSKRSAEVLDKTATLIVDIGYRYVSAVVYSWEKKKGTKVSVKCVDDLGSGKIDQIVFDILSKQFLEKYKKEIIPGSKAALKLMKQVKSLKETLSGLNESRIIVESLYEDVDVKFSMTRKELEEACTTISDGIKTLVKEVYDQVDEDNKKRISSCELIGGGMRIPFIKAAISSALNDAIPLSYTMDSMAAVAIGASLSCSKLFEPSGAISRPVFENLADVISSVNIEPSIYDIDSANHTQMTCMTLLKQEEIEAAIKIDEELKIRDYNHHQLQNARNKLESLVFEARSLAEGRAPHSDLIDKKELSSTIEKIETWIYDEQPGGGASEMIDSDIYFGRINEFQESMEKSCAKYNAKIAELKSESESQMEASAKAAANEKAANPDDDHDNRKLKFQDRMRKVIVNKTEGNSLFKDGNTEAALSRYLRALQHCTKFDLCPDLEDKDKPEINTITISVQLNAAQCNIKLEKYPEACKWCKKILNVDPNCVKALYRLAFSQENLKLFDEAKKNLLIAQKISPDDKSIEQLMKRVVYQIKRENAKRKQMAQKMFKL